jgi:hypothetical protein
VSGKRRILKKRLLRLFPGLQSSRFRITSRKTPLCNCIAWAAGVPGEWWEYRRGYAWPNAPEVFLAYWYPESPP